MKRLIILFVLVVLLIGCTGQKIKPKPMPGTTKEENQTNIPEKGIENISIENATEKTMPDNASVEADTYIEREKKYSTLIDLTSLEAEECDKTLEDLQHEISILDDDIFEYEQDVQEAKDDVEKEQADVEAEREAYQQEESETNRDNLQDAKEDLHDAEEDYEEAKRILEDAERKMRELIKTKEEVDEECKRLKAVARRQ